MSGAALRSHQAKTLDVMVFNPRYVDPDMWIRPAVNPNRFQYYEYIVCYVDDVLCISSDASKSINSIQEYLKLKYDKIADPYMYLGATFSEMSLEGAKMCQTIFDEECVKSYVTNVVESRSRGGRRLPSNYETPLYSKYYPWLEESPKMKLDGVQHFQELICQCYWSVDIGHVDIILETPLLSSYLAMPRIEFLYQVLHISE